jgi:hypothetical protein
MASEKNSSFRICCFDSDESHFNLFPCALGVWSRDFARGRLNGLARSLISTSEILSDGTSWLDYVYEEDREQYTTFHERVMRAGTPVWCDYRILPDDVHKPKWIREVSSLNDVHEFSPWDVTSIYFDITDLKLAHANGQEQGFFQGIIHDLQNRIHVLAMAVELAGVSLRDLVDERRCSTLFASIDRSVQDLRDCLSTLESDCAVPNTTVVRDRS